MAQYLKLPSTITITCEVNKVTRLKRPKFSENVAKYLLVNA